MSNTPQPEAMRLADAIDPFTRKSAPDHLTSKVAADELRRLDAENQQLRAQLDQAVQQYKEDAERWREVIWHVGADRQCGGFRFTLYTLRPERGSNPMQGAVCQHFTKAIDAAIRARSNT